jgi:hypothetical protein
MAFHVLHVILGMPSSMERLRNVYIIAGPDLGTIRKHVIINKLLSGLKTSTVRFHEHLAHSLLQLCFKKTRLGPDLWTVDKLSGYEYLAAYVDDFLTWRNDPIVVRESSLLY